MAKDLLLVIDMQNVYGPGGEWCCPKTSEAAKHILDIIAKKKDELDVIFTTFIAAETPKGVWKQYNVEYADINNDAYANEMIDELKSVADNYPIYSKSKYSSLSIPQVKECAANARRVIVTGVVAECCVLFTVMDLIDEGDYVVYLTDAVAGFSEETEKATECVLSGLDPLHVKRMTAEEYINEKAF